VYRVLPTVGAMEDLPPGYSRNIFCSAVCGRNDLLNDGPLPPDLTPKISIVSPEP
jgi:hypothetical protein